MGTIQKHIAKFKATGTVMDRKKSGRPSVITDIVVAKVLQETQHLTYEVNIEHLVLIK